MIIPIFKVAFLVAIAMHDMHSRIGIRLMLRSLLLVRWRRLSQTREKVFERALFTIGCGERLSLCAMTDETPRVVLGLDPWRRAR